MQELELGKKSEYNPHYNPEILFAIPRHSKRAEIGILGDIPFYGQDIWNHYEVSWLNKKGKPIVVLAEIRYSCETPNIIESKSMKLYFNSFNNTHFATPEIVKEVITKDISERVGGEVAVKLFTLENIIIQDTLPGISLDNLDVDCHHYEIEPNLLKINNAIVTETLTSNLLKSNCLVTNQPDWGSIQICYTGKQIQHEGLLQYLVSFRNHNEFHEQCVERIYMDIMRQCQPQQLVVYGRYTRRGGLDINPYRSSMPITTDIPNIRLSRQ